MKLHAKIDGETVDVEIIREGDKVTAKVGERTYEIEASEPEPGVFALRNGHRIADAAVSSGSPLKVSLAGFEFEVELSDPKRLRGSGIDLEHAGGTVEIKTMMPGKVVRILAEAGSEVKKGEGVIVVEAMKMQNEMKSPKDGTVREFRCSEGDTVNAGDVLVVIE